MLFRHGDADCAIAQFRRANLKSPHNADALEYLGEALMLENRSDLALAEFAQAENYAPHWGRLHLKWAEALSYAGRKGEAKAQLRAARALALTPSERTELARADR